MRINNVNLKLWLPVILTTLLLIAPGVENTVTADSEAYTIGAMKTDNAPTIDGIADEDEWNDVTYRSIDVITGVQNLPDGPVKMKALYDDDNIYFLTVWTDSTASQSVWVGGVEWNGTDYVHIHNENPDHYDEAEEDRFIFQFNINTANYVENGGCQALCHGWKGAEEDGPKDRSGMYTEDPDETVDEWHWKAGRSNPVGIFHDKWVGYQDAENGDDDTWDVEGGHHTDGTGFYVKNQNEDGTPKYYEPNPTDDLDGQSILQSEVDSGDAVLITNETVLEIGQRIPGQILNDVSIAADELQGTGDIQGKATFVDGVWTLETMRSRTTDSPTEDVQFDDDDKIYGFGIAVMDDGGHYPQHPYSFVQTLKLLDDDDVNTGGETSDEDEKGLPALGMALTIGAVSAAAIISRKNE